jgi:hypothetical protein
MSVEVVQLVIDLGVNLRRIRIFKTLQEALGGLINKN